MHAGAVCKLIKYFRIKCTRGIRALSRASHFVLAVFEALLYSAPITRTSEGMFGRTRNARDASS